MKTQKALSRDFFSPAAQPIKVINIRGLKEQHPGDLTDIKHFHDFAELVIVTEGYGVHWIDGADYPVTAGDVFVIQGETEHYFKERHELVLYNIMFDGRRLKHYLKSLQGNAGFNALFLLEPSYRRRHNFKSHLRLSRRSLAHIETALHRMLEEQTTQKAGYDTMLLSMLLELAIHLSRQYSKTEIPQAQALYRLGKIIGKLESDYTRAWTVAEIARISGMSKSSLMTTFREVTGSTPIDYLIRIRLQQAAEMLAESDLSISQIALACGFKDSNYFSRQFKKIYQTTPLAFRRKSSF